MGGFFNRFDSTKTSVTATAVTADDLEIDSGTLSIDATNNRVGIGLTDPASSLHIKGSTPALIVEDSDGSNYTFAVDGTTASGVRWHFGSIADLDAFMTCGAYDGINRLDTSARDFHIYGTNTTTGLYFDESAGLFGFKTAAPSTTVVVEGAVSLKERAAAENKFTDATCDYNNDPTITMDSTANLRVGLAVSGSGIPGGATVASITNSTTFELSASTTGGAVTNGTLTFNPKAAYGQLWVKNTTPNELWFTDDAGTDTQLGAGGGGASANDLDHILHQQVFS